MTSPGHACNGYPKPKASRNHAPQYMIISPSLISVSVSVCLCLSPFRVRECQPSEFKLRVLIAGSGARQPERIAPSDGGPTSASRSPGEGCAYLNRVSLGGLYSSDAGVTCKTRKWPSFSCTVFLSTETASGSEGKSDVVEHLCFV